MGHDCRFAMVIFVDILNKILKLQSKNKEDGLKNEIAVTILFYFYALL